MKVAILAGGFGTRLSEETTVRPKPMVEIGGKPILWHIMQLYSRYGFDDFVVLGGYKVEMIREYFLNYRMHNSDFTVDLRTGDVAWRSAATDKWRVTVLDTGIEAMTGGRVLAARDVLGNEPFCLTYGDGVSDVDLAELLKYHRASGALATVTAVTPPGRFGVLRVRDTGLVEGFREKAAVDVGLINGGFFVCEPGVFDYIDGPGTTWEQEPLQRMVDKDLLAAYIHPGHWQNMDTIRDKMVLEEQYATGAPPWLKPVARRAI